MDIIYQKKLQDFARKHADGTSSITSWRNVMIEAIWTKGADILADFPKATYSCQAGPFQDRR
jgi:mRNA interferase HigB